MSSSHSFSKLNTEYEDIMTHNFGLRKYISLAYHSSIHENLLLRAKFYQRPRVGASLYSNEASCSLLYQGPFYNVKTAFKTPGTLKSDSHIDLGRFVKNLQSNVKVSASSSFRDVQGKVKFFWPQDMYKIKTVFDFGDQYSLKLKAFGTLLKKPQTELGTGVGISFNFSQRRVLLHCPSVWYYWDDNKLLLTYKANKNKHLRGSLEAQMYNRLNSKTDVAIGTAYDLQRQSNNISFGFRHRHSRNFTIKTRVDSNLDLRAAFDLLVTKNVHLVITSTYDLVEQHGSPDSKQMIAGVRAPFSLKVSFGDIAVPDYEELPQKVPNLSNV